MAQTAFHTKLEALGAVTPEQIEQIARRIKLDADAALADVECRLKEKIEAGTKSAVDTVLTPLNSIINEKLPDQIERVIVEVQKAKAIDFDVTPEARDCLSALNQVEGITLDQIPDDTENNKTLGKLTGQKKGAAFTRWLEALKGDTELQTDFANLFEQFKKGQFSERAERFKEIQRMRARIVRHFAQGPGAKPAS